MKHLDFCLQCGTRGALADACTPSRYGNARFVNGTNRVSRLGDAIHRQRVPEGGRCCGLEPSFPKSAEETTGRSNSPTACRKTWLRERSPLTAGTDPAWHGCGKWLRRQAMNIAIAATNIVIVTIATNIRLSLELG